MQNDIEEEEGRRARRQQQDRETAATQQQQQYTRPQTRLYGGYVSHEDVLGPAEPARATKLSAPL